MSMRADFYVYVLFRESGVPFYVGKGSGRRWLHHERDARAGRRGHRFNIIRKMFARGFPEIPTIRLHEGLTEARAHEYEQALIVAIGRRPHGPLVNLTNGGEGMSGWFPSAETRAKKSAALRGKPKSPEHKAKLSAAAQERVGWKHSPETRAKIGAAQHGREYSPETLAKMSAAARNRSPETRAKLSAARRNPSPEWRAKISAAKCGRKLSPEWRANIAAGQRGKKHSPETLAKMRATWARKREAAKKLERAA